MPGDGTDVGFKDLTGLAAGASLASTLVVNLPASFAAGSYFLSAVADAGNAIPEAGGNDGLVANGRVAREDDHRHPAGPRGERAHRADPRRTRRHRRGHRDGQERRGGACAPRRPRRSSSISPTIRRSTRRTWSCPPARPSRSSAPARSRPAATTLAIPASVTTGNKFILARADALDQVTEAQEGNNVTARAIEIGDFADLQITAVAGPVAAGTGRPMTVSFTTRNAGVAPVGPFRVNLFLAGANPHPVPGDGVGVGFKDFLGLAAGASLASTLVVDLPASFAAGSYFLSAVADAGNAIPETGGNDGVVPNGRVAAKTITVIRPDLVVSALTGPIRAARGGIAAVTATVKNLAASPATAPASSLKFYLSDDQTFDAGDVELSPVRTVPTLGARRGLGRDHHAGHPGLRHHGQQVHPRACRRTRSGHRGPGGQQRHREGDRDRRLRGSADHRGGRARHRARGPEHDRLVHGQERRHRAGGRVQRHRLPGAGRPAARPRRR